MSYVRRFLCRIGLHFYGPWTQTRFNPSLNLYVDHQYCACGRCKSRLVDGRQIPKGWTSMDLPPGYKGNWRTGERG